VTGTGDGGAGAPGVRVERRGRVGLVTIEREQARNAIDTATLDALEDAFAAFAADEDIWAVVVTGSGERAFSAGMDLKAFAAEAAAGRSELPDRLGRFFRRPFPKPLVAAVNGAALAAGLELVLACDLVVASEGALFGIPEVRRGLVAGAGGLVRLPRRVPYSVALELAFTGQPVDARRAYELGLVNRVVPAGGAVEAALALAGEICANAPLAVRASKEIVRSTLPLEEQAAFALNDELMAPVFASDDALEGARAFADKREPRWTAS
jgi:enoyl-CoA hydratase